MYPDRRNCHLNVKSRNQTKHFERICFCLNLINNMRFFIIPYQNLCYYINNSTNLAKIVLAANGF